VAQVATAATSQHFFDGETYRMQSSEGPLYLTTVPSVAHSSATYLLGAEDMKLVVV